MGRVSCNKHGMQSGQLCCDHVRLAVNDSKPLVLYNNYRVDLGGNGETILSHMLCKQCADQYGLSASELIAGEVWEDEKQFPHVCPTCGECFAEWSKQEFSS